MASGSTNTIPTANSNNNGAFWRMVTYDPKHTRSVNPLLHIYNRTQALRQSVFIVNSLLYYLIHHNTMKKFAVLLLLVVAVVAEEAKIRTGNNLVSSVLLECSDMSCVKYKVLNYLDTLLGYEEDARQIKVCFWAIMYLNYFGNN